MTDTTHEYTPDTQEVRARAISGGAVPIVMRRDGVLASQAETVAGEEFDRWLAQHDAEAWDEGLKAELAEGNHIRAFGYAPTAVNPYRKTERVKTND